MVGSLEAGGSLGVGVDDPVVGEGGGSYAGVMHDETK